MVKIKRKGQNELFQYGENRSQGRLFSAALDDDIENIKHYIIEEKVRPNEVTASFMLGHENQLTCLQDVLQLDPDFLYMPCSEGKIFLHIVAFKMILKDFLQSLLPWVIEHDYQGRFKTARDNLGKTPYDYLYIQDLKNHVDRLIAEKPSTMEEVSERTPLLDGEKQFNSEMSPPEQRLNTNAFSSTSSPIFFPNPRRRRPEKAAEGEEKHTQDRRARNTDQQKRSSCLIS